MCTDHNEFIVLQIYNPYIYYIRTQKIIICIQCYTLKYINRSEICMYFNFMCTCKYVALNSITKM